MDYQNEKGTCCCEEAGAEEGIPTSGEMICVCVVCVHVHVNMFAGSY